MARQQLIEFDPQRGSRLANYLIFAYCLPVIYVSLFPFGGWATSRAGKIVSLFTTWPRYITGFDVGLNFLAYVPLGFLTALAWGRLSPAQKIVVATLFCVGLSTLMETLQAFLPTRTSSCVDILSNGFGALLGATIAAFISRDRLSNMSFSRDRWFVSGACGNIGLALIALWFLTQLNPSFPLFSPILASASSFDFRELLAVSVSLGAVAMLLNSFSLTRTVAIISFTLTLIGTIAIKLVAAIVLLSSGFTFVWISPEVILGGIVGLTLVLIPWRPKDAIFVAIALLLVLIVLLRLEIDASNPATTLGMFSRHYHQFLNYIGLAETTGQTWPFFVVGFFAFFWRPLISQKQNSFSWL